MLIKLKIQEMAQEDIIKHISPTQLNAIRSRDEHPEFRAYIVGHTGETGGKAIGVGKVIKKWYNSAIEKLFGKINIGTKLFEGHNKDNDNHGRMTIGEVVGKTIKRVGDKLQAIAITWFKPEHRKKKLDVCSIEGDVKLRVNNNDVEVEDVDEITGIAFGDSDILTPGFGEATLQASIQMFAKENLLLSEDKMTQDEMRKLVKEGGYSALDLFGKEEITNDNELKKFMELQHKKTGYDYRKKEEELERKKVESETNNLALEKLKQTNITLATKVFKYESKGKLEQVATDRKLDDMQKKYLAKKFEKFNPNIEDTEKSLNDFVENTIKEYKDISSIFQNQDGKTDQEDLQVTNNQENQKQENKQDYTQLISLDDTKDNDLIPK